MSGRGGGGDSGDSERVVEEVGRWCGVFLLWTSAIWELREVLWRDWKGIEESLFGGDGPLQFSCLLCCLYDWVKLRLSSNFYTAFALDRQNI